METILYVTNTPGQPPEKMLTASGFDLVVCGFDSDVRGLLDDDPYRVIILDFDRRETLAKEIIQAVRTSHPHIVIIAIDNSCRPNGDEAAINGINAGADEYFTYPFDIRLLAAKTASLFRRLSLIEDGDGVFHFGPHVLKYADRAIETKSGESVKLTMRESSMMRLLCLYKGRCLPKKVALKALWYDDTYYNGRCMDVFMVNLRNKLKPYGIRIETERSKGYVLIT